MNPRFTSSRATTAPPGSTPTSEISTAGTTSAPAPRLLDIRPLFERGESPCDVIDATAASLDPGQALVLLVPFEPVPLYTRLGRQGFSHESVLLPDGTWQITFRQSA